MGVELNKSVGVDIFYDNQGIVTSVFSKDLSLAPKDWVGKKVQQVSEDVLKHKYPIQNLKLESNRFTVEFNKPLTTDELLDIHTPKEVRDSLTPRQKAKIKEFFRRVEKKEFASFLKEMKQLPPLTKEQLNALKSQDWKNPIFADPNIERYALRALIYGQLDRLQLSEILLFIECTKRNKNCETLQLYSEPGVRNEAAIERFKSSLTGYTDKEIEVFLQAMSELPPQNTQFYSVPVRHYLQETGELDIGIMERVVGSKYRFLIEKRGDLDCQMVLHPRLMNGLLRAKYGEQAMIANPILGESLSAENFKNPRRRDALIPSSLFPKSTPKRADNLKASPLEFYSHDAMYHIPIESANPHREAWIELADHFRPSAENKHSPDIYTTLLDREFRSYEDPRRPEENRNAFLYTPPVEREIPKHQGTYGRKEYNGCFWKSLRELRDRFNDPMHALIKGLGPRAGDRFYKEALAYIKENSEAWDEEFHIHL